MLHFPGVIGSLVYGQKVNVIWTSDMFGKPNHIFGCTSGKGLFIHGKDQDEFS